MRNEISRFVLRAARLFRGNCVLAVLCAATSLIGGCVAGPNPADPYEKNNRKIYNFNEGLDQHVLKPVANAYTAVVPGPIRDGIGNGFDNLLYLNVILNDFLQGKNDRGLNDAGRMAVNSTVGVAGFFDVASGWGLPAHENDFGLTLAQWGVKNGPYIVIPVFGPSTYRDSSGLLFEYLATPTTWVTMGLSASIPFSATQLASTRSRADIAIRFRDQTALDPYVFTRDAYLQYRKAKVARSEGLSQPTTAPAAPSGPSIYDEDTETRPTTTPSVTSH